MDIERRTGFATAPDESKYAGVSAFCVPHFVAGFGIAIVLPFALGFVFGFLGLSPTAAGALGSVAPLASCLWGFYTLNGTSPHRYERGRALSWVAGSLAAVGAYVVLSVCLS